MYFESSTPHWCSYFLVLGDVSFDSVLTSVILKILSAQPFECVHKSRGMCVFVAAKCMYFHNHRTKKMEHIASCF